MLEKNFHCFSCMNKLNQNVKFCPICGNEISNEKIIKSALNPGTILNQRYLLGHVVKKDNKTLTYIALDKNIESRILVVELFIKDMVERLDQKIFVKNFKNEEIFEEIKTNFSLVHQNLMKFRIFPNALKIYEVFFTNGTVYVVKEISKGITFNEYLSNNYGELPWSHSTKLFLDLIKFLRNIHSLKMIHRDLNPNNLYFENNMLKIIDFTNAKINTNYNLKFDLNDGYSAPE